MIEFSISKLLLIIKLKLKIDRSFNNIIYILSYEMNEI